MTKRIKEAEPYERVLVELENDGGEFLTLARALGGGDIAAYRTPIAAMAGNGTLVKWMRKGTSKLPDITSVVFPFAGIGDAQLRKNRSGMKQRLTIRTLIPIFLVDEISIISEQSPVLGSVGFDSTARKRMLSYLLTGRDDEAIVAEETKEIASAKSAAKLALIDEILAPIEARLGAMAQGREAQDSIERVDAAIERASAHIEESNAERLQLLNERRDVIAHVQRAENQLVAIDELLVRYKLLDGRYGSDLDRLDFISEGAHYFGGLQEVRCPLCDQPMDEQHYHWQGDADAAQPVHESARAEAAKIIGHRSDLNGAIENLQQRRAAHEQARHSAQARGAEIEARLDRHILPALRDSKARLDTMIPRRLQLESIRLDREKSEDLHALRLELESASTSAGSAGQKWAALSARPLRAFCDEIEAVLKEWAWEDAGRVVCDEKEFDIVVDGQPRQSHGKGVRAILFAAFVIGLLRYCNRNKKPHPGFVFLDSPLTTYKKGQPKEADINPEVEAAIWRSLAALRADLQIIVLDNKEPPQDVAAAIRYQWFARPTAVAGERAGFIPG